MRVAAFLSHSTQCSVKTIVAGGEYSDIILAFPDLSRPPGLPMLVKHDTVYRIRTTPDPALFHRPRLVATEKLKIAKD